MNEKHVFHLQQAKPHNQTDGGSRLRVTKKNFPVLHGMSFYKLFLEPKAVREPHWHANADELGYCLKGKLLVSLYATKNTHAEFLVQPGEAFFVPSGTLHSIENVGDDQAEILLEFSHEEPEDFALSSTFGMFSDSVLGNTWNVPSSTFQPVKRSLKEVFIAKKEKATEISKEAHYASPFHYNLQASPTLVANEGGTARVARHDVWPLLTRQALYSLALTGTGMREPHWHPETAELGYVHEGTGKMSILSPSGDIDTYEINPGDVYFIPKAYPHHIENLTNNPLHILIFFDQGMPADIGFTASVKSFPNDSLTAIFKSPKDFFEKLPTYYEDLFIVKKTNPLDR